MQSYARLLWLLLDEYPSTCCLRGRGIKPLTIRRPDWSEKCTVSGDFLQEEVLSISGFVDIMSAREIAQQVLGNLHRHKLLSLILAMIFRETEQRLLDGR